MHEDAVTIAESEYKALLKDKLRLDTLDRMNSKLNAQYGTEYKWKVILSPNVVRLFSGRHDQGYVGDIDLNDANAGVGSVPSCREAIDRGFSL